MTFEEFSKSSKISIEEICREIFRQNRGSIQIKKEEVAVKNMVKIFNATLKLSHQKGFQVMTLRDLCRESGLSMGGLYAYIPSKEALLSIIHAQGSQVALKIMQRELAKVSDPRNKLHITIKSHLFLSEEMSHWFYFLFMETKNLSKEMQKRSIEGEQMTEKLLIDILEDGASEKIFSIKDAALTASAIKALMQDWYLKPWKYSRRKISVEAYADFIIELIESYIIPGKQGADNEHY